MQCLRPSVDKGTCYAQAGVRSEQRVHSGRGVLSPEAAGEGGMREGITEVVTTVLKVYRQTGRMG